MKIFRRGMLVAALATALLAPHVSQADPFVTNPFGNLTMQILSEPSGTTPGKARLTIVTAAGQAFTQGRDRIYFGFRVMGSEDMQMTSFSLPNNDGCIVSDFAGSNTDGWQGEDVFGTASPLGSGNAHMRMVGGFLEKKCGNIVINVSFQARPLVAFYGAFFGYNPAPWHNSYGDAPWSVVPTGGNATYNEWWNIWGTFDSLGYSNACTSISAGQTPSCG